MDSSAITEVVLHAHTAVAGAPNAPSIVISLVSAPDNFSCSGGGASLPGPSPTLYCDVLIPNLLTIGDIVVSAATTDGRQHIERTFHEAPGGVPPVDTYVALGDSFQSGEGAYSYLPQTDLSYDQCHRSTVSYPFLIAGQSGVPATLVDVACSGAEIRTLVRGQNGEPAQYNSLSLADTLVTVGIGGNNLGFPTIMNACVKTPQGTGDFSSVKLTCRPRFDQGVKDAITELDTADPSTGLSPLQTVYNTIRKRAPHARIVVVGYPHFFKPSGNDFGCWKVFPSDEKWIDAKIDQFDAVLERNALSMGAEYVGGASEFDGHELCGNGSEYLNGIVGLGNSESFHPNVAGHRRIADLVLAQVGNHQPTSTFDIMQGQTVTYNAAVAPGQAFAAFFTAWPGSDVQMTLTDPNGRAYTRSSTDPSLYHSNGPTNELFRLTRPIPGTWRVSSTARSSDQAPENLCSSR